MTLLVDNYDSFTNNLCDYLAQLGQEVVIIKNDTYTIEEIATLKFDNILISPGPRTPEESGICLSLIETYHKKMPILGICLGHQAIGVFFGATLKKAIKPMHGYLSTISLLKDDLFQDIPELVEVMRYHSLILDNIPKDLSVLATTAEGEVMIVKHTSFPIMGIQFHPESILTHYGIIFLKNWFKDIEILR